MKYHEQLALDVLVLAGEVSRRADEFDPRDLHEADQATYYACKILSEAGFSYNADTGEWERWAE